MVLIPFFDQNFFVNATESQVSDVLTNEDGSLTDIGANLERLDEFFTIIFAVELSINMFAHWFRPFISDGWNIFDLVVVLMSLVALGPVQIPVNVIRSLRALRVIRLFGRLKGLKNIIMALASSVVPVLQALLILLIVCSICKSPLIWPVCRPLIRACRCDTGHHHLRQRCAQRLRPIRPGRGDPVPGHSWDGLDRPDPPHQKREWQHQLESWDLRVQLYCHGQLDAAAGVRRRPSG